MKHAGIKGNTNKKYRVMTTDSKHDKKISSTLLKHDSKGFNLSF